MVKDARSRTGTTVRPSVSRRFVACPPVLDWRLARDLACPPVPSWFRNCVTRLCPPRWSGPSLKALISGSGGLEGPDWSACSKGISRLWGNTRRARPPQMPGSHPAAPSGSGAQTGCSPTCSAARHELLDEAGQGWRLRSDWELAAHPLDGFERVEPALDSTIDPRVFAASLRMSLTFATTDSLRLRVARATTTKRPS